MTVFALYSLPNDGMLKLNYEDLMIYQTVMWYLKSERFEEAGSLLENLREKAGLQPSTTLKQLLRYLYIQMGREPGFLSPYLK